MNVSVTFQRAVLSSEGRTRTHRTQGGYVDESRCKKNSLVARLLQTRGKLEIVGVDPQAC